MVKMATKKNINPRYIISDILYAVSEKKQVHEEGTTKRYKRLR